MRAGRHSTYRMQTAGYLHRKNSSYRTFGGGLSPSELSRSPVHPVPDQTPGGEGGKVMTDYGSPLGMGADRLKIMGQLGPQQKSHPRSSEGGFPHSKERASRLDFPWHPSPSFRRT